MKLYVASSWKNKRYEAVLKALRDAGHDCYDFKNPGPDNTGFAWSQIDENWEKWGAIEYLNALVHPIALDGYLSDFRAMKAAEGCVLVLPCGRSAHLEAGWCAGQGKKVHILLEDDKITPELMYLMAASINPDVKHLLKSIELGYSSLVRPQKPGEGIHG